MEEQNGDVSKNSNEPGLGAESDISTKSSHSLRKNFLKFAFALGGIIVFIFLIAGIAYWQQQNGMRIPGDNKKGDIALSSKVSIAAVGENAFGALADLSAGSSNATRSSDGSFVATNENAAAAQDKVVAPAVVPVQGGGSSGSSTGAADMIYPYEPIYYVYVYKGETFAQNETKMNVLKRTAGVSNVAASALASVLDFNLFDLGKLDNAKVANMSFSENKEFGYRTDIDLNRGSASIYKNYERWPNNYYAACKGDVCSSSTPAAPLTQEELPGDEEIINAANSFLNDYKVDFSAYGTPEVSKSFLNYTAEGQQLYVPEEISVVYPLIVDSKSVYESYGEINGLNVVYDIRNKKVSSMYNLMTHDYQASAYEAETDVVKILEAAKNVDGVMPMRDDGKELTFKTVEVELGTPTLSLENMWRYEENQSSEYLVPCLVFPIKNSAEMAAYGRKRVIIPLIKDFINQNNGGPVMLMKGAASTGYAVDDSAVSTPVSTGTAASSGPVEVGN